MPALLTRPSSWWVASASTWAAFVMSSSIGVTPAPSSCGARIPASTCAPSSASNSAVVRPMPDEAPVTSTVRPSSTAASLPGRLNVRVLFAELAAATEDVRALSGRKDKVARLADALGALAVEEREPGAGYLAGAPRQRVLGIGWAALKELPAPASSPSLSVAEVDAAFEALSALSGTGSQAARRAALHGLLARATSSEQDYLRALIIGDLRQGALAAVV